jgi:hypothetical protein
LPPPEPSLINQKIRFDLSTFDDDGLYGPPDGLRAAAYEFCIPTRDDAASEVAAIDPTVHCYGGSPGRVRCAQDQSLCLGSTHQPDFRSVLTRLAQLEYVERIELCFAE